MSMGDEVSDTGFTRYLFFEVQETLRLNDPLRANRDYPVNFGIGSKAGCESTAATVPNSTIAAIRMQSATFEPK